MKDLLSKIIQDELSITSPIKNLTKLHGDASYRTYSRLELENGNTYIIMKMPAGKSSASEEITNFNGEHKELPFINVSKYLASLKIRTPKIYHYDKVNEILVLEDLGDALLYREVAHLKIEEQIPYYRGVIELLVELQNKSSKSDPSNCIALQRSFDDYLLNWEFDHFIEYGIEARLNLKTSDNERSTFNELTRSITKKILDIPYTFTHRDYQSRNIFAFGKNDFALIDFQDALMGPCVYDLVALLRDSYISIPQNDVDELVDYFATLKRMDKNAIQSYFALATIQRKLKDAGRFVYIEKVKGNNSYLQFIPTSIGYAKQALSKFSEYQPLIELIDKYF